MPTSRSTAPKVSVLVLAEAMALGLPVIGTAYSGSADFLNPDTGYPVPFTLVPVKSGEYPDHAGQVWAEPDVDAAAAAMRAIVERPGGGAPHCPKRPALHRHAVQPGAGGRIDARTPRGAGRVGTGPRRGRTPSGLSALRYGQGRAGG